MWSIVIPTTPRTIDSLSADLWEMGTTGLIEEPDAIRAFFDDSTERQHILERFNVTETTIQASDPPTPDCDPVFIGNRFVVAPSWIKAPTPPGRFRLTIDNTSAFGSGRHETTQLCLEVLEKHLKAGAVVADIGCGSGILAAAAHLLGAGSVISCDIHEDSVRTAKTLVNTPIFVGSADCIKPATADLVLANISLNVLDLVAADLKRIAKANALVVIAGFLSANPPRHFLPIEILQKGEWACWLCRPEKIDAPLVEGEPAAHSQQWWL